MKHLATIFLCIFLFSCSDYSSTESKIQSNEAIFILIENGGTIEPHEQEDALNTALHLLQQTSKLSKRKATRDVQVHILFSAHPNRIAWSGTARRASSWSKLSGLRS